VLPIIHLRLSAILMMRTITNLLTSIILAGWIGAIAILSIQNITPISLKFLAWETIEMRFGIVLAFSAGIGAIGAAIAPLLWQLTGGQREQYFYEEDDL
jgi:uncharacterized integral membrane protein